MVSGTGDAAAEEVAAGAASTLVFRGVDPAHPGRQLFFARDIGRIDSREHRVDTRHRRSATKRFPAVRRMRLLIRSPHTPLGRQGLGSCLDD